MTLIVGVRCSDGVVIGTDSAATFASADGATTISQPTDEKIAVVDDRALIAVSGQVGLGQVFREAFEDALRSTTLLKQSSTKAMIEIGEALRPHIASAQAATVPAVPAVGAQAAAELIVTNTLVAVAVAGTPTLFEYEWNGQGEERTEALPFACIGSGKNLADPFMAFLKDVLWGIGTLPTLSKGTFATLWTLEQSIKVAPGGLAPPAHIFWLSGNGKNIARELESGELEEHRQMIQIAEGKLRDLDAAPTEETPEPPT